MLRWQAAIVIGWLVAGVTWAEEAAEGEADPLRRGLVAHWSFDEGAGAIAKDSTGQNPLTMIGLPHVKGVFGTAVSFDGRLGHATMADGDLKGAFPARREGAATSFTFATWMRLYREQNERQPILVKEGNLTRGFMWSIERNGRIAFHAYDENGKKSAVESPAALPAVEWHHVAVAVQAFPDEGRSVIKLYEDGKEVASNAAGVLPINPNNLPLEIGRLQWSRVYQRFLFARLDDFRIYDRALTAAEIGKLAELPRGVKRADE